MARPLAMKGQGRQAVAAGCHEAVGWPVAGGRARRRNCRRHVDFYILFFFERVRGRVQAVGNYFQLHQLRELVE
jgi:hypothetical protein